MNYYSWKPLKDLAKEHRNTPHFLVFLSIFQILLVTNVGTSKSFKIFPDIWQYVLGMTINQL